MTGFGYFHTSKKEKKKKIGIIRESPTISDQLMQMVWPIFYKHVPKPASILIVIPSGEPQIVPVCVSGRCEVVQFM